MKKTQLFTCDLCHVDFESERPEEEAVAEYEKNFGEKLEDGYRTNGEKVSVLCDECYQKVMRSHGLTP